MRYEVKKEKVIQFVEELEKSLRTYNYVVVQSCNKDFSKYLVKAGTEDQISYYGKPEKSFRVSDHWSWRANVRKCSKRNYIQCLSVDVPRAKPRAYEDGPSKPIRAIQVAYLGNDGKYHCVYGEKFDPKHKKWIWVESGVQEVLETVFDRKDI